MYSTETILNILNELGSYAIPASLLISILIAVAGILPSIFVTSANVLLFGPLNGFIISWLGEIVGATVSFYLYKVGFKKNFEQISLKYPLIQTIMNASGKKAGILVFQARLLPFVPSGIVTLAASISAVRFGTFLTATTLGKIPSIVLEAFISYDIVNFSKNWIRLALTLIAVITIMFTLKRNR